MFDRVFILELSGPTLDFIQERSSYLPNFRNILEHGAFGKLYGPLQPLASNSFATLFTGKNPGTTGMFDFFNFASGSYQRTPYSRSLLKHETFYERISACGLNVGLLNTPLTFPLPKINGFVVSGDEDTTEEYATPKEVQKLLDQQQYQVQFSASYARGREKAFFDRAMEVLRIRRQAFKSLFKQQQWTFGMLTLHMYGELLHAFWKYYDTNHPEYQPFNTIFDSCDPFLEALQEIDSLLGEIIEATGPRGLLMALGAWGHSLEHSRVHLNTFLENHGYLKFKRTPHTLLKRTLYRMGFSKSSIESLAHKLNIYKGFHYKLNRDKRSSLTGAAFLSFDDIDWTRTKAVSSGYLGQVYLNVKGQRPSGCIDPKDYLLEREKLQKLLIKIRDPKSGKTVFEQVFAKDELYSGSELKNAPDLIVKNRSGYSGNSNFVGRSSVIAKSPFNHSSDHCQESFFMALGDGVNAGKIPPAQLLDIAPTVLNNLGISIPNDYEGRVIPLVDKSLSNFKQTAN